MVKITIPENMGGELRKLPQDTYQAVLQDLFGGVAKSSGKPKVTAKWLIQSEYSGDHGKDYVSTVGENILDTYSLQENAVWKLNGLYKQVKGENIPHADYSMDEFVAMLKDELKGIEAMIDVVDSDDGERSQVKQVVYQPSRRRAAAGKKR